MKSGRDQILDPPAFDMTPMIDIVFQLIIFFMIVIDLSQKDLEDLAFAMELGVDWVALSFVRGPDDIHDVRKRIHDLGGEAPVIAKLVRPEAIERLTDIIDVTDAVMVARGDLGVEIGPERVPAIQKEIIAEANAELESQPELLNSDPYGAGWICRIEISDPSELDGLMDAEAYRALTEG